MYVGENMGGMGSTPRKCLIYQGKRRNPSGSFDGFHMGSMGSTWPAPKGGDLGAYTLLARCRGPVGSFLAAPRAVDSGARSLMLSLYMPGVIPSPEEKQRRLAVVERTISDRGWSLQIKRSLAAEFAVSTSTIDNYRRELILSMRDELAADELAERRAEFVARLRGHQRAALTAARLGPLAAMMNLEARITGVDAPAAVDARGSIEVILRVPEVVEI